MEAESEVAVRSILEKNTSYNIEYVQLLEENHLAYEKENADFSLTEF
ncbi:hypothetical protein MPTP_0184 [Melissococcus plutonius ATCC 35311]|uniref:Uncharacterized protein n=2 Tax=Melissococcus plutonius TaxID=33970 RepID=F3Y855_MELPT|nr:hypothetical protein MPTP_0184 [Melissococcus plutonius ATCC 35311]